MDSLLKKKSLLTIIGIVLILFVWINLLYLPGLNKINNSGTEREALEQEVTSYETLIAGVGQIIHRVDLAAAEVQDKLDSISHADSVPDFIGRLSELMKAYDITRVKISPEIPDLLDDNPSVVIGGYILTEVEFNFTGQGRYIQLGKFLEALRNQSYFAGMSSLGLHYNKSTNPNIAFEIQVSAYLKRQG